MSDYDPSELLAICDSIVEDGELSGTEIRDLTKWLNNNKDARTQWPGNLFFWIAKRSVGGWEHF